MALGLRGRIKVLRSQLDPSQRYVDLAVRLVVCAAGADRYLRSDVSRLFGGVWDRWAGRYEPLRVPEIVLVREVTRGQYDYCLSDRFRITGAGGRGGGKSEALAQRAECLLLSRPGEHGLVVSPDYAHTQIVWVKLMRRVHRWCLPGTAGVNRSERWVRLVTGSTVRFLSADNPDSLRGWDAHWAAFDEEKDITQDAIDIVTFCCRLSDRPLLFGAGTPEVGEYSERYARLEADSGPDGSSAIFRFPSRDNVFIPHAVFDLARRQMDPLRYRQEVDAEFVRLDAGATVAKGFDRGRHKYGSPLLLGADITRAYCRRKLGRPYDFIAGVDYNHTYPCVAWVYKIHEGNRWVVVGRVAAPDPATRLAQALIDAGHLPDRTVVIDDASGEYDHHGGKQSPNSSARLMRSLGYTCLHKTKNPPIKDRVNAFLAKLAPLDGPPTWGYLPDVAKWAEPTMEGAVWKNSGTDVADDGGWSHEFDAATYPIAYCEPAAALEIPRVTGVA